MPVSEPASFHFSCLEKIMWYTKVWFDIIKNFEIFHFFSDGIELNFLFRESVIFIIENTTHYIRPLLHRLSYKLRVLLQEAGIYRQLYLFIAVFVDPCIWYHLQYPFLIFERSLKV